MSNIVPKNNTNEEVDLGQLFNAISSLFQKLFNFFRLLFKYFIYALKPIVNNIVLITIVLFVSAVLGFFASRSSKPAFKSVMLVKPYYNSKYKLRSDINYFNGLIKTESWNTLANVLKLDSVKASQLIEFKIAVGPEKQEDLLVEYEEYVRTVDSTTTDIKTYDDFMRSRSLSDATVFSIIAKSKDRYLFNDLTQSVTRLIVNPYTKKEKADFLKILNFKIASYQAQLKRIDSLQSVYVKVLKNESQANDVTFGTSSFPLTKEKTATKEYELFTEEIKIRQLLEETQQEYVENDKYYDVISEFNAVAAKEQKVLKNYTFAFPLIAFGIMALFFVVFKAFKFIKDFE